MLRLQLPFHSLNLPLHNKYISLADWIFHRCLLFILRCPELGSKNVRISSIYANPLLSIYSRSIFFHVAHPGKHNSDGICIATRRHKLPFPIWIQSANTPSRRSCRKGRVTWRKRRYMSRRDIIHMPATRLARHSGRRGNITFFPDSSSPARSSNTRVCLSPFFASHARPDMTPVGTWNRADTFSSTFPLQR